MSFDSGTKKGREGKEGEVELLWLTARAVELLGNGRGLRLYGDRMSHIKCSRRLQSPMNYYGAVAFDIYVL